MEATKEANIINNHPIKEGLVAFRHQFKSTCTDLSIAASSDAVQVVFSTAAIAGMTQLFCLHSLLIYIATKNLVLDLIQALLIEPAARILPSQIADRTLSSDLAILYSHVDSNWLDSALAIPLIEQIVRNKPNTLTWNDMDIWLAVFGLIARITPVAPLTAFEKAVFNMLL